MLRVEVKNLGPIAEGAIQLRPLTIFIGRNSSGKSYMAMLIYCLAKAFRQTFPTAYFSQWFPRDPFSAFMTEVFNQDEAFRSMWDKWIIEYVRLAERQEIIINSMPQPVIDFLIKSIRAFIEKDSALRLTSEIKRCYGASISDVKRKGEQKGALVMSISQEQPPLQVSFSTHPTGQMPFAMPGGGTAYFQLKTEALQFKMTSLPVKVRIPPLPLRLRKESEKEANAEVSKNLFLQTARQISGTIFHDLLSSIYYLPAARSGILQGHKGLARYFMEGASKVGIEEPVEIPKFGGIVVDFLDSLLSIEPSTETELTELAGLLESDVVKGKVIMEPEKHLYPEILYLSEGTGKIGLHRVSSGISELAPMILFLRHVVEPGDTLIIEEPEAHLHPSAQRKLAKVLVNLDRANTRVLITTHSEYLVDQLSNYIRLGQMSVDEREKQGFAEQDYLLTEDIGVHLFKLDEAKAGTVVERIEVTPEDGIADEEFTKVDKELYEETYQLRRKLLAKS